MDKVWLSTRYYTDDKFDDMSATTERMFTRLLALAGALEKLGKLPAKPWVYVGIPRGKSSVDDLARRGILAALDDGTYEFPSWAAWQAEGDEMVRRKAGDRKRKQAERDRKRAEAATQNDTKCVESVSKLARNAHTIDALSTHTVSDDEPADNTADQQTNGTPNSTQSRDMSRNVTRAEERREEKEPTYVGSSPSRNVTRETRDDGDEIPLPPEPDDPEPTTTRGSLALVPTHQPDGRRVPRHNRQQALAKLNATARSSDAERIATAFAASLNGGMDRTTRTEIAQVVDTLLADHIDPQQIANGLTAWQRSDSWAPSQIRRFVAKAAKPAGHNGVGKPTTKALDQMAVAEQIIAEMENPT